MPRDTPPPTSRASASPHIVSAPSQPASTSTVSAISTNLEASRLARSLVVEGVERPCLQFIRSAAGIALIRSAAAKSIEGTAGSGFLPDKLIISRVVSFAVHQVGAALDLAATSGQEAPQQRTAYDFRDGRRPSVTFENYVERMALHTFAPPETFVLALVLVDRLSMAGRLRLSGRNIHRIWMAAFIVASKFNDDHFHSQRIYARVAGLPIEEINSLEGTLLCSLGFRVSVGPEEWQRYADAVEILSAACAESGSMHSFFVDVVVRSNQTQRPRATTFLSRLCRRLFR